MNWIVVLWQLFIAVTMVTMLKGQIKKKKKKNFPYLVLYV